MSPSFAFYTIGHSTRSSRELIRLLESNGIRQVVDVRTIPHSQRNPQFNQEALKETLAERQIRYFHMPDLGGLRHPRKDSENLGWHNSNFRGYADYMQTSEFLGALGELVQIARRGKTAILCAEAVPWRCHRSLIADALFVRGVGVLHILGTGRTLPHHLTPWARVKGERLTYPSPHRRVAA